MLKEEQLSGQVLDHLGLIYSVIDKISLIDKVDKYLPVSSKHGSKVTMGQRVAAMILNGLGFIDDRLYMFPEFLENKPVDRLFGPQVTADQFNDDALGRCLDAIAAYGVTKLFSQLAFEIGSEHKIFGHTAHFDTTTLTVFGSYEQQDNLAAENGFKVTHGHAKDHRPDLKQMVQFSYYGGKCIPIWMEAHSGNASDKVILQQAAARMKAFCAQLQEAPSFLYVADSAMYEKCVLEAKSNQNNKPMYWLSRVPNTIKEAKALLALTDETPHWLYLDQGYKVATFSSTYGDVSQRWLLVFSQQAYLREITTLQAAIQKAYAETTKKYNQLSRRIFNCKEDAAREILIFENKLKYYTLVASLEMVQRHKHPGKPRKGTEPQTIGYKIKGALTENPDKIAAIRLQKGRFILATTIRWANFTS